MILIQTVISGKLKFVKGLYEDYICVTLYIMISGGLDALLCCIICHILDKNDGIQINMGDDGTVVVQVAN